MRVVIIKEAALVIEDFSALGQISMVAALTILQSMDYTTASLPTTVLSTQTECFGDPQRLSTNQWIKNSVDHWQLIPDLDFKGALIGYIGHQSLIPLIQEVLLAKLGNRPVIVDPVMGDEGKLYPGLDNNYLKAMQQLCQHATVLTPNWTELCLLANQPGSLKPTEKNVQRLLSILQANKIDAQVVITGVTKGLEIGCLFQSREEGLEFIGNRRLNGHFYGTGDTFAALLLGLLLTDCSLTTAVRTATQLLAIAVNETAQEEPLTNRKYGLRLGQLVKQLATTHDK